MQLPVADVDGHDVRRAPLQDAIGEPARGRPGVEDTAAPGVDAEAVEGGGQLLPAPADEGRRIALHDDGLVGSHLPAGLVAGAPPTSTRPAAMSAWARSRVGA